MLEILKDLKSRGKILFLLSNSHFEGVDLLMNHAYGKDWRKIFDFIGANA